MEKQKVIDVYAPEWTYNKNIYEVNIRQYTPEGTFNAFSEHLPRLKQMGTDILWLMPIHPVGEKNRKGSLGSNYSVRDYTAVNPEFGNLNDFKNLVTNAHELGMYVILDWVANHSAWDNVWTLSHPEFYTKNEFGGFKCRVDDWTDVIDFDYTNMAMRQAMIDALKFWVTEADIDGFRCDVAMMVPTDFWEDARQQLEAIKPVFMLAEAEEPDHHFAAFDACYSWELLITLNDIAAGRKSTCCIDDSINNDKLKFPNKTYRLRFITNHDENTWNGTEFKRMGSGVDAFTVLYYTLPGMPLVYSGQESAFNRNLAFFDKDIIEWDGFRKEKLFGTLNLLKHNHESLWNGNYGGEMLKLTDELNNKGVYAFIRYKKSDVVIVVLNLSNEAVFTQLKLNKLFAGYYTDIFNNSQPAFYHEFKLKLNAWDYRIFVRS